MFALPMKMIAMTCISLRVSLEYGPQRALVWPSHGNKLGGVHHRMRRSQSCTDTTILLLEGKEGEANTFAAFLHGRKLHSKLLFSFGIITKCY